MTRLGYTLSSEEHPPLELARFAARAEEAGFEFALVSDHYHPWIDEQGQSPFVWGVLGAISQTTERLVVGTGVTCPTIRIHPALVAQAAATAAALMPDRFFLGVGTGENLNEHILADRWPSADERLEMLEEAIELIRELWQGELVSWRGRYFTVDRARVYTLPDDLPPIAVAAAAPKAARLAGRLGDALVSVAPDEEVVHEFESAGGNGKPRYGQLHVCWAESEEQARETAHRIWPNSALKGDLGQELALPSHFEESTTMVSEDDVAEAVVCGPDPERHRQAIEEYVDAGFDHVYVHQIGPDQEGFIRFYEREILPALVRS